MMKLKRILATAAAVVLAAAFSGVSPAEVGAASYPSALEEAAFSMLTGASVRLKTGESGLRFTAVMDKTDYGALTACGGELTFGMLICPYDYIEAFGPLTAESVFGENAVYATENGGAGVRIMCVTSPRLAEYDEYRMCFNGAIVNILQANVGREFFGAGFIALADENGTHYKFAVGDDNRRSAAYVAQRALEISDRYSEEELSLLRGYVETCAQTSADYAVNCYLETDEGYVLRQSETHAAPVGSLATVDPPVFEGYTLHEKRSVLSSAVYAGGKTNLDLFYVKTGEVGDLSFAVDLSAENRLDTETLFGAVTEINGTAVAEENGKVSLSAAQTALIHEKAEGGFWKFTTDRREYLLRVNAYDKIIREFSELEALNESPDGNFLLGGDVYGENSSFRVTAEFNGAFDGGGHCIRGVNVGKGLFKTVGAAGTVKNLRIKDVSAINAALAYEVHGAIENVAVESGSAQCAVQSVSQTARIDKVFAVLKKGGCFVQSVVGAPPAMSRFIGLFGAYAGSEADALAESLYFCAAVSDVFSVAAEYGWQELSVGENYLKFCGDIVFSR